MTEAQVPRISISNRKLRVAHTRFPPSFHTFHHFMHIRPSREAFRHRTSRDADFVSQSPPCNKLRLTAPYKSKHHFQNLLSFFCHHISNRNRVPSRTSSARFTSSWLSYQLSRKPTRSSQATAPRMLDSYASFQEQQAASAKPQLRS